jgi:hypothetical protein
MGAQVTVTGTMRDGVPVVGVIRAGVAVVVVIDGVMTVTGVRTPRDVAART